MINNTLAAAVLGPPLLYLTYPRIKDMGLLYPDVMREEDLEETSFSQPVVAALGMLVVSPTWLVLGIYVFSPQSTMQMALGGVGLLLLVVFVVIGNQGLPAQLKGANIR
jgi:energy-coupling factor transport system substrate-specific component